MKGMRMRMAGLLATLVLSGTALTTGVLGQTPPSGFVEYGALGLCFVLVLQGFRRDAAMGRKIDEKDAQLGVLLKQTAEEAVECRRVIENNTAALTSVGGRLDATTEAIRAMTRSIEERRSS
jgi:hypothetical protein